MVAVPPGQQAVHSVAGAGANTASAFTLPTVSARGVTDAQLTKWKIAFQNLCALQGLRVVVAEGKPPQRDAVKKTWPDLEGPAVEQKFNECLMEYQRENTVLYYYVYSSLNFEGAWETHDLDFTSRVFVSGDLRDGNGLLKWEPTSGGEGRTGDAQGDLRDGNGLLKWEPTWEPTSGGEGRTGDAQGGTELEGSS